MPKTSRIHKFIAKITPLQKVQIVLFEFRAHLALQLERSPLRHSLSYDSTGDRPSCCAGYTLNPDSFVQYVG